VAKKTQEVISCLPPFAFHITTEQILAKCKAAGKQTGYEYLASAGGGGAFTIDNRRYTAPFASSYAHMEPGFSTYLNNCQEAAWLVDDKIHGKTNKNTTNQIFKNVRDQAVVWENDGLLRAMQYRPTIIIPNAILR